MSEKKKFYVTGKDAFSSARFGIKADGFEVSSQGRLELYNLNEDGNGEIHHEVIASFTSDHSISTVTPERVL